MGTNTMTQIYDVKIRFLDNERFKELTIPKEQIKEIKIEYAPYSTSLAIDAEIYGIQISDMQTNSDPEEIDSRELTDYLESIIAS